MVHDADPAAGRSVAHQRKTADLVWCVQAPNRTWFARRDGTCYFTGNTVIWATVGAVQAVFNITV